VGGPQNNDDQSATDGAELKTATLEFHGKKIEFKAPSPSQVVVYHRIQEDFADRQRLESMSEEQQIALMKRVIVAVGSIMVNKEDIGYIDDLILREVITLPDVLPLMVDAINAVRDANGQSNRSERRSRTKPGAATLALD
jgi:hypothetical protein